MLAPLRAIHARERPPLHRRPCGRTGARSMHHLLVEQYQLDDVNFARRGSRSKTQNRQVRGRKNYPSLALASLD